MTTSLLQYWRWWRGALAVRLKILLIRLQEVRTFFRFPRDLRLRSGGRGGRVILYGMPFADWNATLSSRDLWLDLTGVDRVRRLPATPFGSGARPDDVVIAMKTSHVARRRAGRALEPAADAIATLEDKARFAAYMSANRLDDYCPRTYPGRAEAVFPCMLKRTDLSASLGVAIVQSKEHLDELLRTRMFAGHRYILQAIVPGNVEYATYCVCKQGRALWSCSFASELGAPVAVKREDNSIRCQASATPDDVLRQLEIILRPLAYSGPCNIDYKLAADGRLQVFEINPRLGGTLMLPSQAAELRAALGCILANAH